MSSRAGPLRLTPHIRDLLKSLNHLTVDSVSQTPFVLDWGDPRGPAFYFDQASAEGYSQLPVRQGRSIDRIISTRELSGARSWDEVGAGEPIKVDDLVARD